MNDKKQIEEMAKVLNECCNEYDEQGNHLRNKCASCECWSDTNHVCVSYNTREAEALYNAGYRKKSEWISVEERLPEEEKTVLYYDGTNVGACNFYHGHFHIIDFYEFDRIEGVTHWMPLPKPPRKEDENAVGQRSVEEC